jgi:hypothetical protein
MILTHEPPSGGDVKNGWSYTATPPVCLHGIAECRYAESTTRYSRAGTHPEFFIGGGGGSVRLYVISVRF